MSDGLDNCVRELVRMGAELQRASSELNQVRAIVEAWRVEHLAARWDTCSADTALDDIGFALGMGKR